MSGIETIVVPVDFSSHSRAAANRACEIARNSSSEVHLIHATQLRAGAMAHEFSVAWDVWAGLREVARQKLDELCSELADEGVSITSELVERDPVSAIQGVARQEGVGLVVMGTHGHSGFKHVVLGSVAERIIRTVRTPVIAVKESVEDARRPIRRILLATDFSDDAEDAARAASLLARHVKAEVEVFHVVPDPSFIYSTYGLPFAPGVQREMRDAAAPKLDAIVGRLQAQGVRAEARISYGPATPAIVKRASSLDAQLVVMGTRGLSGLKHILLGSVAERVLRESPCSVLIAGGLEVSDDGTDDSADDSES